MASWTEDKLITRLLEASLDSSNANFLKVAEGAPAVKELSFAKADQIIEAKLMFILDSLTFKYSRQPQFLVVQPERITSSNIRISEKIKILNENSTNDKQTKFFKPLSEDLIDPERELDVRNHVDSVL